MTVLAWGGVAYPNAYSATGQTNNLLDAVKWGTDFIVKAHVAPNVLYGQVTSDQLYKLFDLVFRVMVVIC